MARADSPGESSRRDDQTVDNSVPHPFLAIIKQAIRAVPEVKWALGVVGVVSATGLVVVGLRIHPIVAIFGFIIMIIFMAVLLIFAYSVRHVAAAGTLLARMFIWFIFVLFIAITVTVFAAATTDKPWPFRTWIEKEIDAQNATVTVIDFSSVDTNMPPKFVAAEPYLRKYGITITDVTDSSKVVLMHDYTNGESPFGAPYHNGLTQIECQGKPAGFTLHFGKPASRVWFQRASLIAGVPNGITHPAWRACAFSGDEERGCKGERLLREFFNIADQEFVLEAPNITSVRFESDLRKDEKPFGAFCGVVIQRIAIER